MGMKGGEVSARPPARDQLGDQARGDRGEQDPIAEVARRDEKSRFRFSEDREMIRRIRAKSGPSRDERAALNSRKDLSGSGEQTKERIGRHAPLIADILQRTPDEQATVATRDDVTVRRMHDVLQKRRARLQDDDLSANGLDWKRRMPMRVYHGRPGAGAVDDACSGVHIVTGAHANDATSFSHEAEDGPTGQYLHAAALRGQNAVSYTHLTLPTNREV